MHKPQTEFAAKKCSQIRDNKSCQKKKTVFVAKRSQENVLGVNNIQKTGIGLDNFIVIYTK